jgi:hypothetical protein
MFKLRFLFLALFACALGAQGDALPYAEGQPGYFAPNVELARFCFTNNLFSQGKIHRDEALKAGDEAALAAKKLAEEFDLTRPDAYTAKTWGEYLDRREAIQRRRAEGVFKALGASGAESALEFWPEHEGARKAYGQEMLDGMGWLRSADAERFRPCLVKTKEAPRENERVATWAQPYVMAGEHFTLVTDLPWGRALRYARLLERFYEIFYEVTGEYLPKRQSRNLIWLCAKPEDFIKLSNTYQFPMTEKHEGAYLRWHGFSIINATRADEVGRLNKARDNLARTLFHESVHRLAEASVCGILPPSGAWEAYGEKHGWIVEAIAVIFENLEVKEKGHALPSLEAQRKWSLDKMKKDGKAPSLAAIFVQNTAEFGSNAPCPVADKYAIAGSVAWYCVFVKKDAYKAAFFTLLIDQYRAGTQARDFASRFGVTLEDFEKAWKSYALGK